MSKTSLNITCEAVLPYLNDPIPDSVFGDSHTARFAVGQIACGDTVIPGFEDVYLGYGRLRKNVYVDKTGMLPRGVEREDGTEADPDDDRSDHFCVVERVSPNAAQTDEAVKLDGGYALRVVGAIRIIRHQLGRPLPIEQFFPSVFPDAELPERAACEVSRYIAVHPSPRLQFSIAGYLINTAVEGITFNALGPTYAVVEPPLKEQFIRMRRMPLREVAPPRHLDEYAAVNLGIEIDVPLMAEQLGLLDSADSDRASVRPFRTFGLLESSSDDGRGTKRPAA